MSRAQVATFAPDGAADRRWLGRDGVVSGLRWSYTLPGGDEQMTLTLTGPQGRPPAIKPGRVARISPSGWTGQLDMPKPGQGGWEVTAHGQGTYGGLYRAEYSKAAWSTDAPVANAISRGLGWQNPGITGVDTSQRPDPGIASTVADYLEMVTAPVTKTWRVDRWGALRIMAWPSAVTRLLVLPEPAGRDTGGFITRVFIRFSPKQDTYDRTYVENTAGIAEWGVNETYVDFSDAGTMSTATAQAKASGILGKYQAVSWAGPMVAMPGQYLTLGGVPVDHATEREGEVVRLIFAGPSSTGEVTGKAQTFILGRVEYEDDTGALGLTPAQTVYNSLSDLLATVAVARAQAKPATFTHPMVR